MKKEELYLCIVVRQFPAQAMLRLRAGLRTEPCAVLDGTAPLQTICALNCLAQSAGISVGMTRVEAESVPLHLLERSPAEEQSARAALLSAAAHFTPRIEECSRGTTYICVLDIAGTRSLFGPPAKLAADLLDRLRAVELRAAVTIAGNFHAARCLALARNSGYLITAPNCERELLAQLPLSVLDLTDRQGEVFDSWGIHSLDALNALPESALTARLGQQAVRLQQLARGSAEHLFVPLEEEIMLEESLDLDTPVELLDSLLFVLRVLIEQLLTRAIDQLTALAAITLTLRLENTEEAFTRTVRPAEAGNDLKLWMKLLQLDLTAHPPQAAILNLHVQAETSSRKHVQLGLFTPQMPEADKLDVTLARLRALVGEDAVGMPALKDTHQPDSFEMAPFHVKESKIESVPTHVPTQCTRGAVRILRPSELLTMKLHGKTPSSFTFRTAHYDVEHAYGPWIASGEWWSPTLWAVQQWDVIARASDGDLLYGSIVYQPLEKIWKMAGLYD